MGPGGDSVDHVYRGAPLLDTTVSVLDVIDRHADEMPRRAAVVLTDAGRTITWRELRQSALQMAASLRQSGVGQGDLVGVMLRNDDRFVPAILGAWYAGAATAPMPIPGGFADVGVYAEHIAGMAAAAGLRHVLYDPTLPSDHTEAAVRALPDLAWIDASGGGDAPPITPAALRPEDLAVVSYTSGSTSAPRGVELTHGNLTAAVAAFAIATGLGPDDAWGIWTPLFHDFALVSMVTALWVGAPAWIWSPAQFIRNPARWLAEFGRNGLTHYSGPNFSFDLMRNAASDELMEGVSLAAWRVAVSGGEPVSASTVRSFTARFAPYGFRPETIVPGYGLAEVTLGVAVPPLGTRPNVITVSRAGLTDRRRVEPLPAADPEGRALVSVGRLFPGMAMRIVDELGNALPAGLVGEIEVASPSITRGYRGHPDLVQDGWLKTGDLGFVHEGGLYICGRIKDVVNVRGTKYHPEDLEPIVTEIEGVRKGRCCVVGEGETHEQMAVIVETRVGRDELARLRAEIYDRLVHRLGMSQIRVYLVEPRTIQVTSNAKVKRQLMRRLLESGQLVDLESVPEEVSAARGL